MYKDIITYELAEDKSIDDLLRISEQIVNDWMKKQTGFVKWEIHKTTNGRYTDIVYWESEADAKVAEAKMSEIPNAMEWYGCYKEGSISTVNVHKLASF